MESNTFLFFGRIVEYKGLDILLESISFVKLHFHSSFKLIIAGSGDMQQYVHLLEEHKNILEIHNEDIPDSDVAEYFERSEFVVLPYKDATAS